MERKISPDIIQPTKQRKWAKWGVIVAVAIIGFVCALFFGMVTIFKHSDAFKLAVAKIESDERALKIIGKPITTGFPMGHMRISGPSGKTSLSFHVEGPSGKATAHLDAVRDLGKWQIKRLVLEQDETGLRVDLTD